MGLNDRYWRREVTDYYRFYSPLGTKVVESPARRVYILVTLSEQEGKAKGRDDRFELPERAYVYAPNLEKGSEVNGYQEQKGS